MKEETSNIQHPTPNIEVNISAGDLEALREQLRTARQASNVYEVSVSFEMAERLLAALETYELVRVALGAETPAQALEIADGLRNELEARRVDSEQLARISKVIIAAMPNTHTLFGSECDHAEEVLNRLVEELEQMRRWYHKLLYQVAQKFPDETRNQTALRYIREAESAATGPAEQCSAVRAGGQPEAERQLRPTREDLSCQK